MEEIKKIKQARFGKEAREPAAVALEKAAAILQNEDAEIKAEVTAARNGKSSLKARIDSLGVEAAENSLAHAGDMIDGMISGGKISCGRVMVDGVLKRIQGIYAGVKGKVTEIYNGLVYYLKDAVWADGYPYLSMDEGIEYYETTDGCFAFEAFNDTGKYYEAQLSLEGVNIKEIVIQARSVTTYNSMGSGGIGHYPSITVEGTEKTVNQSEKEYRFPVDMRPGRPGCQIQIVLDPSWHNDDGTYILGDQILEIRKIYGVKG